MKKVRSVLAAAILVLAAGAFVTATTASACPGADKAATEDGE